MANECANCKREFTTVRGFDAHQRWDYTKPQGQQLTCLDPGSLTTQDGKPRYKLNAQGRWTRTDGKHPYGE